MAVLFLILIALVSYFLGGINGAIITSKYLFRKDVRDFGSGNAGLTNFYRSFGVKGVVLVLAMDIVKSVAALLLGRALMGLVGYPTVGKLFAGFCLMLGHLYPAFYEFRGGKGALCAIVVALMVDWRIGLICLLVFAITVIFTQYVSLGSIIGAACFPFGLWAFGYTGLEIWLGLFCTLALILKHHSNIGRIISGTESKLPMGGTSHGSNL